MGGFDAPAGNRGKSYSRLGERVWRSTRYNQRCCHARKTSPSRPYSVPTAPGNTTLALPGDASAYTLTRAIATDGLQNNRLLVTYTLSGSDAPALQRTSSVLIAASSWCP